MCLGVLRVSAVEQSVEGSWWSLEPRATRGTCQRPRFAEAATAPYCSAHQGLPATLPSPISDGYLLLSAVLLAKGAEPGEEEEDSSPRRVHRDTLSLSPRLGQQNQPHTPSQWRKNGAGLSLQMPGLPAPLTPWCLACSPLPSAASVKWDDGNSRNCAGLLGGLHGVMDVHSAL